MGLGDVVTTEAPRPIVIWRKLKSGDTILPGSPCGFDAAGDITIGATTTDGPIVYAISGKDSTTPLKTTVGGVVYYAVLKKGRIVTTAGGAIKPNKKVKISATSKVSQMTKTAISAGFTQAELVALQDDLWKFAGVYIKLESDDDYTASDAADTNLIIVEVDS